MTILEKLGLALPSVENPARYMGGEVNSVVKKNNSILAKMALIFPDLYEIGMSCNDMHSLYHVVNKESDLFCEMSFAPWPDMTQEMKRLDIPLYTHASWTAVSDFDVVGINLQTEFNFTNIPYILELSKISIWSEDREEKDPLIIGLGPITANPEPIADFFDAFIIGETEHSIMEVMRTIGTARKEKKSRNEILKCLSSLDGIYIPLFHTVIQNKYNQAIPKEQASESYSSTKGIRRLFIPSIKSADYPKKNLIANMQLEHHRFSVEVMRGCSQGCRFCQSGIWSRPCRELPPDDILDIAKEGIQTTGEKELDLFSLYTADYQPIEALIDSIIDDPFFNNINIYFPGIKENNISQNLANKIGALKNGRKTITLTPEASSARIRKMINKNVDSKDLYNAAEYAFSNKINKIKLQIMIGFPTETLDDIKEFCDLTEQIIQLGRSYSKGCQIAINIGIFIPKAFTPLQWSAFVDKETILSHIHFIKNHFHRFTNVKINWRAWESALLEAIYSRGDRSLSKLIYLAFKKGLLFENNKSQFHFEAWDLLWQEMEYDISWVFQTRDLDEVFPWDFIHAGVSKSYLKKEWLNAFDENAAFTPNCKKGACQKCGIPGSGTDIQQAPQPSKYKAPDRTIEEIKELFRDRNVLQGIGYLYQITFEKTELSRFLSHQNLLSCFERAFFCSNIPIKFSDGYSPKPKMANIGALPLGLETYCEIISIELLEKLDLSESKHSLLLDKINTFLPHGICIVEIKAIKEKLSKNLPKAMIFRYTPEEVPLQLETLFKEKKLPLTFNHRGAEIDLNKHILALQIINSAIILKVKCNDQGGCVSPYTIYAGLMSIGKNNSILEEVSRTFLIQKIALEW